jgi:hypothetical protein
MSVSLLAIVYLPPLQSVFGTAPLYASHWAILVLLAGVVLVVDELMKAALRKSRSYAKRKVT